MLTIPSFVQPVALHVFLSLIDPPFGVTKDLLDGGRDVVVNVGRGADLAYGSSGCACVRVVDFGGEVPTQATAFRCGHMFAT